jgi:adenylate kinase
MIPIIYGRRPFTEITKKNFSPRLKRSLRKTLTPMQLFLIKAASLGILFVYWLPTIVKNIPKPLKYPFSIGKETMKKDPHPIAVVFIGPPGSGKGTQAERLKGFQHISTGDLLRAEIQRQTPLGLSCKEKIEKGEMVPDSLISSLIESHFSPHILLDGYPRTVAQAEWLQDKVQISQVFFFDVDVEKLVHRLTNRRVCPSCKSVYNLVSKPPVKALTCDKCNNSLIQRADDVEEVIRNRMRVYQLETAPLMEFYDKKGVLTKLDASKNPDEIMRLIQDKIFKRV